MIFIYSWLTFLVWIRLFSKYIIIKILKFLPKRLLIWFSKLVDALKKSKDITW